MVAGETDPVRLAALAHPGVKCLARELARGLARTGDSEHHRFLLGLHPGQIDALDAGDREIDREVETTSPPFAPPSSSSARSPA